MTDGVDINPAGGDIGCNKHAAGSRSKPRKRLLAGILRLITVKGIGQNTHIVQIHRDFVGPMLGAGKNNDARQRGVFENIDQQRGFGIVIDAKDFLINTVNRCRLRGDFDTYRIMQNVTGDFYRRWLHGC